MIRRKLRFTPLCCALILCAGLARAGQVIEPPPPRPDPAPFVPTLRVRGAEEPVRLQALSIQAAIQGGVAEISLDMRFFNPNNRVLEGELQFPLMPGQEISGLALDIQGEMRNGVPVAKARGQEIFDSIVRRNVDPALLEATQGNSYKLRLYPIPAKGFRRVMVRVLQPLTEKDGLYTLRLPLGFARDIGQFSVEALVAAVEPPRVDSGSLGLVLRQEGLLYRGKVEKSDLSPEGWLTIGVPASAAPTGNLNAVRWQDKIYFTATASVEMRTRKRALPASVTVVWDASGSGQERDHAREYALLDRYFAALGDGRARLVVVRNAAEAPREFAIRQGDWAELKAYLHALAYDGATDLAAWKPTEDCPEYLLFTDGLANFGADRAGDVLPALLPGQRLYAITASTQADHNLLRHASQGRLVDLLRHDDDAAARLLLEDRTVVRLAPEELAGKGEALLEPLSADAAKDAKRLHCRLAGWLRVRDSAASETVTLRLEHPDGQVETHAVVLPLAGDIPAHADDDAPLAARLWGRYAIAGMEANPNRHRAAILRLGQELGIVSRETSLIVLETAADYARYGVTPPASLKAEVERLRADGDVADGSPRYLSPEQLARLWAEKVAWWEKDFSKRDKKAEEKPPVPGGGEHSGRLHVMPSMGDSVPGREADAETMARDSFAQPVVSQAAPIVESSLAVPGEASPPPARQARARADSEPSVDDAGGGTGGIGIALQAWRSDAPYIERMNKAKKEDMYAIYLDERPSHSRSSSFYLDMADRFFAAEMPDLGLRVLSNLAEIEVESRQLLRVLAYRLLEAKQASLALGVLERVRELAPYEPQSLRDLANAHRALGNYREAADLLYEVARRVWDGRFSDINTIALTELNALIATSGGAVDASVFDSRLIKNLASDLRVVLTWDTDNTDMDLWVTDPNGEKCYYSHRLTAQGGAMTRDCTGGYGPEEFMLRKAKPGVYRVEVEYYGSSQQVVAGDVTLYVTMTTGFGTPDQAEQVVTMRLQEAKNQVLVGEFTVR